MVNQKQLFGKTGESVAVRFLKKQGYRIIEKNYRTDMGEIDIIARDSDTLVFVEVKARNSDRFGSPKAAVTPVKQRKLSMAALCYLKATCQLQSKARFDVVAIVSGNHAIHTELIKNAFELAYT